MEGQGGGGVREGTVTPAVLTDGKRKTTASRGGKYRHTRAVCLDKLLSFDDDQMVAGGRWSGEVSERGVRQRGASKRQQQKTTKTCGHCVWSSGGSDLALARTRETTRRAFRARAPTQR